MGDVPGTFKCLEMGSGSSTVLQWGMFQGPSNVLKWGVVLQLFCNGGCSRDLQMSLNGEWFFNCFAMGNVYSAALQRRLNCIFASNAHGCLHEVRGDKHCVK